MSWSWLNARLSQTAADVNSENEIRAQPAQLSKKVMFNIPGQVERTCVFPDSLGIRNRNVADNFL